MRERRYHRKTRAGCVPCKQRHIKCDERRPICLNCSRRGTACSFLVPTQLAIAPQPSGNPSTAETHSENRTFSDILTAAFDQLRIPRDAAYTTQDLELLHHYSVSTSLTICDGRAPQELCQVLMPQLALSNEFLMRGIFGLAALHKARLLQDSDPKAAEEFVNLAAKEMNLALSVFRQEIQQISDKTCQPLMAFSTILSRYIFASSRHGFNPFRNDANSINFATWIQLIRGGIKEIRPWMDVIRHLPMGKVIPWKQEVARTPTTANQAFRDAQLACIAQLWNDRVQDKSSEDGCDLSSEQIESLSDALDSMRKCYLSVPFLDDEDPVRLSTSASPAASASSWGNEEKDGNEFWVQAGVMRWLHSLDDTFILMLHRRHPFTLVLVAHYAVLLNQIEKYWWLEGIPQDMLAWAAAGLHNHLEWIKFPIKELGPVKTESPAFPHDVGQGRSSA